MYKFKLNTADYSYSKTEMEWLSRKQIDCVGVDELIHSCYPEKNVTICGSQIKRKKLLTNDGLRSNCYECDFYESNSELNVI